MATKAKMCMIQINPDPLNPDEQTKIVQLDGKTWELKIGQIIQIPKAIAEIAVNCGYCSSYTEI